MVNTSLFASMVVVAYALLHRLPDNSRNTYVGGLIGKHHRIDSIATAKIIFAGGSNLAFGINSQMIEEEFHLPVVNLGLHGGLGASFILEELRHAVKPGDRVFVSLEYFLSPSGAYKIKKIGEEMYPPSRDYYEKGIREEIELNITDTRYKVKNFLTPNRKTGSMRPEDNKLVYCIDAFNRYGDVVSHLNQPNPTELAGGTVYKYEYWPCIAQLNEFYAFAMRNNIRVYYLFPCIASSEFIKNEQVFVALATDLSEGLKIEILNTPTDFVYDDADFFDTIYHLNAKGREKRTRRLIAILKQNRHFMEEIAAVQQGPAGQ